MEMVILDNWTKEPASSLIFGNAIESGIGRQVPGMWRRDVVESLKEVAPGVVRFSGDCTVSVYDWENFVGLDEFMTLSRLADFEPQICFNMVTSEPFKARCLVEYLNAPATEGMGRRRALNGHEEPYGVRFFEMDNEPGRNWTSEEYAEKCVAFAREMRLVDPAIEFLMAAYSYELEELPKMLEIAGEDIQYVIYRDGSPTFVKQVIAILDKYNEKKGTRVRIANTAWVSSSFSYEPFEDPEVPDGSWYCALNGARRLLDYISYGGEHFAMANFNNMCNPLGQNVIEVTKDTCYLSCMGRVYAFFHRVFEPCTAAIVDSAAEGVFAQAAKPVGRDVTQLYIVNHTGKEQTLTLPEGQWRCVDGLKASTRLAKETEEEKCVSTYTQEPQGRRLVMQPFSLLCLES